MLPATEPALKAAPFPSLRADLPSPLYVFGTASLIGINAATVVAESAARVLDALFTLEVRRRFSARTPGDWNIPLADSDADTLCRVTPDIFCVPSVGLTGAVAEKRYGYATWSFFPPQSEALVAAHMQPLMEGRLGVRDHLAELDLLFARERRAGLAPRLD